MKDWKWSRPFRPPFICGHEQIQTRYCLIPFWKQKKQVMIDIQRIHGFSQWRYQLHVSLDRVFEWWAFYGTTIWTSISHWNGIEDTCFFQAYLAVGSIYWLPGPSQSYAADEADKFDVVCNRVASIYGQRGISQYIYMVVFWRDTV